MRLRRGKAKQLRAPGEAQPATAPGAVRAGVATGPRTARAVRKGQKRRKARGPARQTRWLRVLGLLIATGGGVAIGFGWAGAAQVDCVECQIPFLLSGGAAGIGLIIFGVALMLLAQIRTESRRLGDRIEHALGLRVRPEDQHRPLAGAAQPGTREQPTAPSAIGESRGEDTKPIAATPEPRAEEPTSVTLGPAPNPLSAMPVDSGASESGAPGSDAATLAATTMAGGVMDTEGEDSNAGDATPAGDEQSGGISVPAPQAAESPEALGRRSDPEQRRGFFRRRKGA